MITFSIAELSWLPIKPGIDKYIFAGNGGTPAVEQSENRVRMQTYTSPISIRVRYLVAISV